MLKKVRRYYLSFVPPSKTNRVKLNLRAFTKSGKRYIVPKDVSLKINKAVWELQRQHVGGPVEEKITLNVIFILPDRRRRDIDNIMKTLGDCLVYSGIIKDDSLIFKQVLEKIILKGEEGVIIEITKYNEKELNEKKLKKFLEYKEGLNGV